MSLKLFLGILAAAWTSGPVVASADEKPVAVYFDLGKTLVDHEDDFSKVWHLPDAHDYLAALRKEGLKLGLIVNYPADVAPSREERVLDLMKFIDKAWNSELDPTGEEKFDWSQFEVVLVPPKDNLRKPDPYLFREAVCLNEDGPTLFIGENTKEITVARDAVGMAVYMVGQSDQPFFLPAEKVAQYARDNHRSGVVDCSGF